MSKSLKIIAIVAVTVAGLAAAATAKADNADSVSLTFASGATFSGTVDFANDYSSITGVDGTLNGYQGGIYTGTGSENIDWVWGTIDQSGANTPGVFGTWLLDGTPAAWDTFIGFAYDYTNAPTLVLADVPIAPNSAYNAVNYSDLLVSGSIEPASPTPEPGSFLLLGSGLLGLAGMVRRKMGSRV